MDEKIRFSQLEDVKINLIEDVPWAQESWKNISEGFQKAFLNWAKIVLQIGDNEEVIGQWVPVFIEQIETTCCELVFDMEMLKSKVIAEIEELLIRIQELCTTLKLDMPVLGTQNLGLFKERSLLKNKVEEYETLIKVRLDEIDKLNNKHLELCRCLGEKPKTIKVSPLPSEEELDKFREAMEKMEDEKFDREDQFLVLKEEILQIVKELKIKPSTDFERSVVLSEDSSFLVTNENMKQLVCYHKRLLRDLEKVKDEILHLWTDIENMWFKLEISMDEQNKFRAENRGNSVETLRALEAEQKRCEYIKKANMKVFIDKSRTELEKLWEKCHCSGKQKNDFQYFYSDCYTEDLLELHEAEVAKWKTYYMENKNLILLLEKHQDTWTQLCELDEKANGPDRFKNRGGQLLKEEKQRNKLSKNIPHIESDLLELAEKFECKTGTPFLFYGKTVKQHIHDKHEKRDMDKQIKSSGRKNKESVNKSTPVTSKKNLFPSVSAQKLPNSAIKRKIATDSSSEDIKKSKPTPVKPSNVNTQRSNIPTITVNSAKRKSQERKKRIEKCRRISRYMDEKRNKSNKENDASVVEYDKFQIELSSRSRSTLNQSEHEERLQRTPVGSYSRCKSSVQIHTPQSTAPIF